MYAHLKKKYGQNFLIDKNISSKITDLIKTNNLNILEIGPGDGKLTEKIIKKRPKNLDLVEIDEDLIQNLNEKFSKCRFIRVINEDVIKLNFNRNYDLVISNLPYNLSSKVLEKLILLKNNPKMMILMFQKEFAQRLVDKKLNSINSLVKCFFDVKVEFNVSKSCFRPIPKVESSVLKFEKLNRSLISKEEVKSFISFKRHVFSYKRKTLGKVLKKYSIPETIKLNSRAENMNLIEFIKIFRSVKS